MKNSAEETRIRHFYRKMIISGKAKISLEGARRLVGPDCAYHLYGRTRLKGKKRAG